MQGVNDVIDHLAAKLSVPAQHLWAVLVRQAQAEAIANVVLIAFAVAFLIVFVWNFRRLLTAASDGETETQEIMATILLVGGSVVAVIAAISVLVNGYQAILYFVNPEYYAVSKILSALTGK